MTKMAVIRTGGKQYLVKENDEIVIEHLSAAPKGELELDTLAVFNGDDSVSLGNPILSKHTKALVVGDVKGEKIRVSRFKAKVRYRKVTGFKPQFTKIKIISI